MILIANALNDCWNQMLHYEVDGCGLCATIIDYAFNMMNFADISLLINFEFFFSSQIDNQPCFCYAAFLSFLFCLTVRLVV